MNEELKGSERFMAGVELAKGQDCLLVDVRTPEEYAVGHVPGSVNVPVEHMNRADWDETKTYYLYCMSGGRSERAMQYLREKEISAENIGGIIDFKGEIVR